jgi:hypothetical protein
MINILGSIVNMIGTGSEGNLYDYSTSTIIFTLKMNKIFI